jgi:hypothetical protein
MNPDLRVALACGAGLLVLLYVLPVIRLKMSHRAGAQLRLVATTRERVEPRFLAAIDPLAAALGRLGFTLVGYLDGPGDRSRASGIRNTVVFRAGDGATGAIVYVIEQLTREGVRLSTGLQFATDFGNSGSVNTGNSPQPSLFHYRANRRVYRFPGVRDITQLYDLHRRLVARAREASPQPQPATLDDAIQGIQEITAKDMAYQAEMGDYVRADDGAYRFTWKGAIRAMAILGPGFKMLRLQQEQQRAADLAAELLRGPPPG